MAGSETFVQRVLHVVSAELRDVSTRRVPEPLEAELGSTIPLGSFVEGNVSLQRLKVADLHGLEVLQELLGGPLLKF